METVRLLHSAHKGKRMNTMENYYIQFFYQHTMIIKDQTTQKNLLFQLISDIQLRHACAQLPLARPNPG